MSMKKITLLSTAAAVIGLAVSGPVQAQEAVRIGTSSVGSVFYTIAVGASEIITKHER